MSFWKIGEKRHYPNKPIKCQFCDGDMVLRWSKIFAHCDYLHEVMRRKDAGQSVEEVVEALDNLPTAYSYANDMEYKCKDCGAVQIFGVAISHEQFKKFRDANGGSYMFIDLEEWNEDEKIAQQLKDLGYFGG